MITWRHFSMPDEFELIAFFEMEPSEKAEQDGYWRFRKDDGSFVFDFSINTRGRSIQTQISVDNIIIASVSHESANLISIDSETLTCSFSDRATETVFQIPKNTGPAVRWHTINTI